MSVKTTVEISESCRFEMEEHDINASLTLDYTEHSSDHWHSDSDTSHDIDKDTAIKIIDLLQKAIGSGKL
tara:strand:+ start:53 stop:262 length:210 start_codon:yes stop_codon:yes gene_type:complete